MKYLVFEEMILPLHRNTQEYRSYPLPQSPIKYFL